MALGRTVRQRRLAAELKRLRDDSGLTLEQVADQVGISRSALSRIENALVGVKLPTVRALLQFYQVSPEQMDAITRLTRESSQQGWWKGFSDDIVSSVGRAYFAFESEASSLQAYEALIIPGILQTPEYTRAVLRSLRRGLSEQAIDQRVEYRSARFSRLADLEIWAILEESTLRRPLGGPSVLRNQIRHLLALADRPNIVVQAMPTAAHEHSGLIGSFSLLHFPDPPDAPVVFVESPLGGLLQESPGDVQHLSLAFDHLRATALSPESSMSLMRSIAEELDAEDRPRR